MKISNRRMLLITFFNMFYNLFYFCFVNILILHLCCLKRGQSKHIYRNDTNKKKTISDPLNLYSLYINMTTIMCTEIYYTDSIF